MVVITAHQDKEIGAVLVQLQAHQAQVAVVAVVLVRLAQMVQVKQVVMAEAELILIHLGLLQLVQV